MFCLDLDLGPSVFLVDSITCMIKIATHTTKLHATLISLYHCTYSTYHCTYRTSSLHIPYFLIAHTVLCHCTYRTSSLRISYVYCTAPFAYVGDLSPSHSSQAQVKLYVSCIMYISNIVVSLYVSHVPLHVQDVSLHIPYVLIAHIVRSLRSTVRICVRPFHIT